MMIKTYTVDRVSSAEPDYFTNKAGAEMVGFRVMFKEHPDKPVKWNKMKKNVDEHGLPTPGTQVEGTIDWEDTLGAKFTQHYPKPAGGAGADRSPKDTADIHRQLA